MTDELLREDEMRACTLLGMCGITQPGAIGQVKLLADRLREARRELAEVQQRWDQDAKQCEESCDKIYAELNEEHTRAERLEKALEYFKDMPCRRFTDGERDCLNTGTEPPERCGPCDARAELEEKE